jgi:predicted RNA binding protein YcfA (HicA-like mRNA interferase family)
VNHDIQGILKAVKKLGWEVERTNSGHFRLRAPDRTVPLIYVSYSPSDKRGTKNIKALLRKYGVAV